MKVSVSLLLLLIGLSPRAEGLETVSLSGHVVDRTRNVPLAGQEVTLVRHLGASAEGTKAVTDRDGAFRFSGIRVPDSAHVVLMTTYLGVPYTVSDLPLKDGAASGVELAVYDTTSSDASVRADAYHVIVNAHGASMEVMEILSLRNEGDRTVLGADGGSLRIPLPAGASDLRVEPAAFVPSPDGFISLQPVPPGPARIRYNYHLHAGRVFSRPVPYPCPMVSVLVHPSDISVESGSLRNQGPVEFEGQSFLHLIGPEAARGSAIEFRLAGTGAGGTGGKAPAQEPSTGSLRWILLGLALVLGGLAAFYRSGRRRPGPGPKKAREARPEDRRDEVLRRIADLDDERESGRIDEASYRKRRAELKEEAVRLTEAMGRDDG